VSRRRTEPTVGSEPKACCMVLSRRSSDPTGNPPKKERQPKHETVVVFDWDDTLLCTTFLEENDIDEEVQETLRQIGRLAAKLLTAALDKGRVAIVTNAVDGWVQHSAKKFLPEVVPLLRRVRVVSARSRFERIFPEQPEVWKSHAFLELEQGLRDDAVTNFVSIGDSIYEMAAGEALARRRPAAVVKIVKLWDRPRADQIRTQLALLEGDLDEIVGHSKCAKIYVQRSRKSPLATPKSPQSPKSAERRRPPKAPQAETSTAHGDSDAGHASNGSFGLHASLLGA